MAHSVAACAEFQKFAQDYYFKHITSSNGLAEKGVQTVNNILNKAKKDNKDLYKAMLEFRNTHLDDSVGWITSSTVPGKKN